MKNILVPLDFSECSKEALKVAITLAKKTQSKLFLLHALDLPVRLATEEPNSFPETIYFMKLARQKFEEIHQDIAYQGVETVDILENNLIAQSIEEMVGKHSIDLVVMGSNGASGMKEVFIGSNAEKVVRRSKVPVLVIKETTGSFDIKRIVFSCDFSPKYADSMKKALSFARLFDAEIDLLYVNTPYNFKTTIETQRLIDSFLDRFRDFDKFSVNVYNDVRVEEGILNFCHDNAVDLICMFPSGRKGIAHLFNGSVSEDLINHAQKPILTIQV